jgi:hypothetical protein
LIGCAETAAVVAIRLDGGLFWVPGCRPRIGISGWVATEISQSSDRPIPITTPARTPNTRVPRIPAIAIQKSKR